MPGGSGIDGKGSYLDGEAAADAAAGQTAVPGGSEIDGKGSYLDGEAAADATAGQTGLRVQTGQRPQATDAAGHRKFTIFAP